MQTINAMVLIYLKENHIPVNFLAKKINYSREGLYRLLHSTDMKVTILKRISEALHHDFSRQYFNPPDPQPASTSHLTSEIANLTNQLNQLRKENDLLTEINRLLNEKLSI